MREPSFPCVQIRARREHRESCCSAVFRKTQFQTARRGYLPLAAQLPRTDRQSRSGGVYAVARGRSSRRQSTLMRNSWRSFPELIGHHLSEFVDSPTLRKCRQLAAFFHGSGFVVRDGSGAAQRRRRPAIFRLLAAGLAEEGRVTSVSGWARDVTAQHESEIRFNELFESLREAVFFATLDGHVLDANPAMVQLLGYANKEELQALNLRELYPNPDDRQADRPRTRVEGFVSRSRNRAARARTGR